MIKLVDKSTIPFFDYFYLLCIIIYAGLASAFVRGFGDIRTIGNAVPLVMTIIFARYKSIPIKKDFLTVIGVFSIYSLAVILLTGSYHYFLWGYSRWLIFFYVTYVICKGYGYRFFVLAETILYHLALIGLVCWIILLIIPGPFAHFVQLFSLAPFNDEDFFTSANILVYTVILSTASGDFGSWYSIARNSGFAWEPGAFACFMCFGICFNALRTNLKLRYNIPFFVFLVALVSTQSTTGYGIFAAMLFTWLIYNRKFGWFLIFIPVFLLMLNLPFMGEKLAFTSSGFSETSLDDASQGESFDRILSFKVLWDEFLEHPLLGYGYAVPNFEKYELKTWSGIGRLLSQFGVIMSTAFVFLLVISSKKLNFHFPYSAGVMTIISILGSMISYMIWSQPFCMAIWMSCLFMEAPREQIKT